MPIDIEVHGHMGIVKGVHTYGNIIILSDQRLEVEVGNFCSMAGTVKVFAGADHRMDWISTYPFGNFKLGGTTEGAAIPRKNTIIGNDVWIGSETCIIGGAQIGHGCVIGAYSIVRGHYPPYSIVYGNPARVQRMRFPDEDIKRLLEIAWWDWPIEEIKEVSVILQSNDLQALYAYAERRQR